MVICPNIPLPVVPRQPARASARQRMAKGIRMLGTAEVQADEGAEDSGSGCERQGWFGKSRRCYQWPPGCKRGPASEPICKSCMVCNFVHISKGGSCRDSKRRKSL